MTKLILVKHSQPRISPEICSRRWVLSEEGRHRCDWLADELRSHGVARLYASLEPKALETAALVAVRTGLVLEPRLNLHENDRTGFGFQAPDELRRKFREYFARPAQITMGRETANGAFQRFAKAIANILSRGEGQNSAIVTHGTVLSVFVAHRNGIAAYDLWACLGLPSYVVLDAGSFSFDGEVHNYPGC